MSIAPDSSKTGRPGGAGSGFWLGLLLLSLAVFGVNTGVSVWLGSRLTGAGATVVDLQGLAQQLDYQGRAALGGNVRAWREFKHTRTRIDDTLTTLARQFAGEPRVNRALARTAATWAPLDRRAGQIIAAEPAVLALVGPVDHFLQHAALLRGQLHALALARVDAGASAVQVYAVLQQEEQLATLVRQVAAVRAGGAGAAAAAPGLQRDLHAFVEGLDGLRRQTGGGRADSAALAQVQASWQQLQPDLTGLLSAVQPLLAAQAAGAALAQGSGRMVEDSRRLYTAFSTYDSRRDPRVFPNFWVGVASGSLLLVAIIGFVWSSLRARQREQDIRYQTQVESNIRNQNAIMQLLDEISSLAEGDLTVNATVTEDMTGAIADAINYAVDELRKLVTTINGTSAQVAASAQETQATAMQLAEAAGRQSDQINSASERINEIAASIEQVSQNSTESADVAQNSVQIAATGAGVVHETIKGMDQIRDQIQETSKRIKRLGESSQEIGSIVELINDISEQTNILALNAAVQAASAGEAGRGFAVVADEVQRLAERTSGATRRIEGLVQTIQADTNEAVSSMEQTTAEVVSGARLAENAGTALTEIERVSNALNDLIKSISLAARQQAGAAADITRTMDVVRRIAAQTSSGAGQTSESIGRLAQLAADLRRSVADFKLPA